MLGAALARTPPADVAARATGAAGARCAAALAALGDETRTARAAEIAALAALVRAPVPAGIERVHPDWLRERLERESSAVVRAVAAGLPDEVRGVAADVLRARGEDARRFEPEAGAPGVAALQRVVFAGLVPLAGAGAPSTPLARELAALAPGEIVRAIETRGAEALGRSLRGAPAGVVARAAASLGEALAAVVLEAARGPAARRRRGAARSGACDGRGRGRAGDRRSGVRDRRAARPPRCWKTKGPRRCWPWRSACHPRWGGASWRAAAADGSG